MARRKLIWHIGLAQPPRPVIQANLEAHREALEAGGVRVAASAEESSLATHELLRSHRKAGLSREQVEGRWARICDGVWQHKGVSLLSTPDLCVADKDQIRLALDPLIGVETHLVVTVDSFSQQLYGGWLAELRAGRTTGWDKYVGRVLDHATEEKEHRQGEEFWSGHELASILDRWAWTVHDDRVHVVASEAVGGQWHEVANRQLEDPLMASSVDLLLGRDHDRTAMPVAPTGALQPLVEQWEVAVAQAGHDLRGDLGVLTSDGAERALPGTRDQLGAAVDALADALAENGRLRGQVTDLAAERDRLDRKRRKWKKRAKATAGR